MEIRAATGGDSDGARALLEVVGVGGGALDAPDGVVVVAEDGGELVGVAVGALGPDPGAVHLVGVGVASGARRQGVGGKLVEALADLAYLRGARRLTALARDEEARAFADAVGLRPSGQVELPSGEVADAYDAELDPPARELVVREGGLRLGQLLKLAGLADTGSHARELLAAGEVEVNGEVELRRGRQIADGDVVGALEQAVRVVMPG